MICHYEVFDLPFSATSEDIKKKYYKLALLYHPDKNVGKEDEATEKFKEVQTAYSVLSDAQERKWYDDHRDAILKGGDGTSGSNDESESFTVDLWPYFSPSCCSGPLDCETGFYAVYHNLFVKLTESEMTEKNDDLKDVMDNAPNFHEADSSSSKVFAFYNYWTNFVTRMSFSWEDKYNPSDVPNRQVRRAIEKENKKFRDIGRKKYNDTVRALASYIRKRDPRVMGFELEARARKMDDERKHLEMKLAVESKRREKRELSRIALESNGEEVMRRQQEREGAFLLADCDSNDENDDYDELAEGDIEDLKANLENLNLTADKDVPDDTDDDESEKKDVCEICNKTFKTEAQLLQHLASKIHRKKAQEMEKKSKKLGGGKTVGKTDIEKHNSTGKVRPEIVCPSSESEGEDEPGSVEAPTQTPQSTSGTRKASKKVEKQKPTSLSFEDSDAESEDLAAAKPKHDEGDSSGDEGKAKGKGKKSGPAKKKESIIDYATASLRSINMSATGKEDSSSTSKEDSVPETSCTDKTKNKYKKKEKAGYFPKAVVREVAPSLFSEDCLDPLLREEGVDVAIMPGPQKKKIKKISLRGF